MADLKAEMQKMLEDKGVEKSTAEYLAELFANSEKGQEARRPDFRPLGACNPFGISPG